MDLKSRTLSNFAELVKTGECKKFKGRLLALEDVYHSIDNQALKNNVKIKSVKLADSVKEIGNQSFYR